MNEKKPRVRAAVLVFTMLTSGVCRTHSVVWCSTDGNNMKEVMSALARTNDSSLGRTGETRLPTGARRGSSPSGERRRAHPVRGGK